ncbi:acetyltransferase [Mycolicibacterium flavescens]|uniref:Acetyltransferase n=1 Tax=Mycolicibacterium flavescens TaxID=1776 RepID=A0A1E3R806_MYCFV|nr:acetyltransferase [Mycolicibacterium flavescens]MCV7278880.1 acetyltransferase [Mycolicibacterium flavescens]ODQ85993.1 acetyltransferase [Mycolicibacterium flavescens]
MSARITPMRLEAFEQLPKHARRCVYWEVDPLALRRDRDRPEHLSDPEFEKEAWLSMVMLEWGSCGQLAVQCTGADTEDGFAALTGDEACLGYAFYAPPGAVPRAQQFPTGPVSADAVLLTSLGVESGEDAHGLSRTLIAAVAGDLVRRGARALEAFGHTAEVAELFEPGVQTPELRPVLEVLGDCSVEQCVLDADLLRDAGFVVVSEHRYFPRLRLELEQGLGWKADVEAALERLLESAQVPVGAGADPRG